MYSYLSALLVTLEGLSRPLSSSYHSYTGECELANGSKWDRSNVTRVCRISAFDYLIDTRVCYVATRRIMPVSPLLPSAWVYSLEAGVRLSAVSVSVGESYGYAEPHRGRSSHDSHSCRLGRGAQVAGV